MVLASVFGPPGLPVRLNINQWRADLEIWPNDTFTVIKLHVNECRAFRLSMLSFSHWGIPGHPVTSVWSHQLLKGAVQKPHYETQKKKITRYSQALKLDVELLNLHFLPLVLLKGKWTVIIRDYRLYRKQKWVIIVTPCGLNDTSCQEHEY